jgi:hypothetical protein
MNVPGKLEVIFWTSSFYRNAKDCTLGYCRILLKFISKHDVIDLFA